MESARSILAVVDPKAAQLPRLADPAGVGNGLVWLLGSMLVAALALLLQPVVRWLESGAGWSWISSIPLFGGGRNLLALSAVSAMSGLVAVLLLSPARDGDSKATVWRDVWLVSAGLLGWAGGATWLWRWSEVGAGSIDPRWISLIYLFLVASGAAGFIGIGGLLAAIGQRSPAYQRLHSSRQSARTMIAALAAVALGHVLNMFEIQLGSILIWVSSLMVAIGLFYMFVNARWIRRALRRPPPGYDELLTDEPLSVERESAPAEAVAPAESDPDQDPDR